MDERCESEHNSRYFNICIYVNLYTLDILTFVYMDERFESEHSSRYFNICICMDERFESDHNSRYFNICICMDERFESEHNSRYFNICICMDERIESEHNSRYFNICICMDERFESEHNRRYFSPSVVSASNRSKVVVLALFTGLFVLVLPCFEFSCLFQSCLACILLTADRTLEGESWSFCFSWVCLFCMRYVLTFYLLLYV